MKEAKGMYGYEGFSSATVGKELLKEKPIKKSSDFKKGQTCYALFVNVCSGFVSFKVSKGRYLGKTEEFTKAISPKYNLVFEDEYDSVDYLSSDNVFETENDAIKHLVKVLNERLKK